MWLRAVVVVCATTFAGCEQPKVSPSNTEPEPGLQARQEKGGTVRLTEVKQIVAEQFRMNIAQLDVNRPLLDYGDELNVVEVVMTLEEKYRVKIPDESFMDKTARGSLGIHKDLSTAKLVEIVRRLVNR
jgi:acyl carrier protein